MRKFGSQQKFYKTDPKMSITTAIIFGLIITFLIIYVTLDIDKFRPKKKYEHQDLIEKIHSRIAKANGNATEQFSLENSTKIQRRKRDNLYKNADFINRHCTSLQDFIISDEINEFDLRKLADLNQIQLQISEAWYPLTIQLIKELSINGWDKKVSCIKEKYATLTVYLPDDYQGSDKIYEIIEKYKEKSKYTCETCGAKGEIRHNSSWDYVACRKHYLENRGEIFIENLGLHNNGVFYQWKDVKNAYLEDFNEYSGKYSFLILELKQKKVKHQGWTDEKLYLSSNNIGFGNFLSFLSMQKTDSKLHYSGLDRDYLKNFHIPEFCEICGYKAVYYKECESCENEIWEKNLNKWEEQLNRYRKSEKRNEKRIEYYQEKINNKEKHKKKDISYLQIRWTIDEGEIYEAIQKKYPKNPDYKILFSKDEYEEYTIEDKKNFC